MYKIHLLLAFVLLSIQSTAQNYFQQKVDYKIHVSLDDVRHTLSADETIIYTNNSPVPLNEIYIHLYPNAYKNTNTPLAQEYFNTGSDQLLTAAENDLGYIDSLSFSVDGKLANWNLLPDTIDIGKIKLSSPLLPGKSITIHTPFRIKIPSDQLSRLGHNGQAYFITQWFPKPAVYDKNGWNYFSYLDKGEYYSEFGSFDVTINLPANYVVGSTGELVDGIAELQWLNEKAKATASITTFPTSMEFPASEKERKTLHYYQDNIHDFAWFADKRWNVLKGEVELPASKRIVTTWSMFTNAEAAMWKMSPEYISRTLKFMSQWVGEYPYATCTAVDVTDASGDGMEYPMITAIGSYGDPFELDVTIVHEVAHNWFYGILGSNERYHPWMDEGFTNFCETRYVYTQYKNDSLLQLENISTFKKLKNILSLSSLNHKEIQYLGYLAGARKHSDVSQDQPSQNLSRANYRGDVYYKTSVAVDYLKSYLGDSLFDKCMNNYFDKWKFKHPDPDDIKNEFEKTSGKDLAWFFNDLMRSNKKIDYSFTKTTHSRDSATVIVKNQGQIISPLWITTYSNGNKLGNNLIEGFAGLKKIEVPFSKGYSYKIDGNKEIPELDRSNNTIKAAGLFKKTEKINFKFLSGNENPERTSIYYIPVVGYNLYNSIMPGIVLHNINFFEKKFEYALMPMYGTRTKDIAGGLDLQYHVYLNNNTIKKITFEEIIGHYAYAEDFYTPFNNSYNYHHIQKFTKFDTRAIILLKRPHPQKDIRKEIEIRDVFVKRDIPFNAFYAPQQIDYNYLKLEYRRVNGNPLDASSQKVFAVMNKDFIQLNAELKQFFCYGQMNKGASIRFFTGFTKINNEIQHDVDYRYNLSGTTGATDYLYDDIYLGRTETNEIWSQQFNRTGAGFTAPTLFYRKAEKWITGFNASTTLPGLIPFKLYANVGTFDNAKLSFIDFSGITWELGVEFPVIKNVLTIYFPFAYSKDIKYAIDSQNLNFGNTIRFELHLQNLNPLTYIRNIYK